MLCIAILIITETQLQNNINIMIRYSNNHLPLIQIYYIEMSMKYRKAMEEFVILSKITSILIKAQAFITGITQNYRNIHYADACIVEANIACLRFMACTYYA